MSLQPCHKYLWNVAVFKYLSTIIANSISIQEDFKRKLRQVNAFYRWFNSFSSYLPIFLRWPLRPDFASWPPFTVFAITLIRRTTLGRTPLNVWSACDRELWQHITLTRDRHPCPRRESNQQSQQARGCRPTPLTAQSLGPAFNLKTRLK